MGQCSQGCNVALASHFVWEAASANLTVVADFFQVSDNNVILSYNKDTSSNTWIRTFSRINVPFPCDCISGEFLGHVSQYTTRPGDTYDVMYNPGVNFSQGSGIVHIPGRGLPGLAIAGISIGGVAGVLLLLVGIFVWYYRKKKVDSKLFSVASHDLSAQDRIGLGSTKAGESNNLAASADSASGLTSTTLESVSISGGGASGLTMDQSVEFSYAELAKATDNFSLAYKIGEGGYGAVYYAELRGEKAAIKKMDTQASKEFLAELKVLTRVYHLNLFLDVLNQPDPTEDLRKLVDRWLRNDYPLESVLKMAQLAKACTHENPQLRPSMRSIVVALMTLTSATDDWDIGSLNEKQVLFNIVRGR
uniref:Protein kinase domain-containing protein n=1 Tax=Fagus sylvatica TaxID=28930 RepID=A0A2N9GJN2_FAGSY